MTKLPGEPAAVPAARRFASQALVDAGRHGEIVDTTRLLVTELTTNAVTHARSPIRLSVEPVEDAVRIEVRDDDPRDVAPPQRPHADAEGGRGLWLVSSLARSWGVNRNHKGKTIWFEVG